MANFDIVISGGGVIGLAAACSLQRFGLQVALLEKRDEQVTETSNGALPTFSAINLASELLLKKLGGWLRISPSHISTYRAMRIWEEDSFNSVDFDAKQRGLAYLGHIIKNAIIRKSLWECAEQSSNITLITGTQLQQADFNEHEVSLSLSDGTSLTAQLLVAADGANSYIRKKAGIPIVFWDYEHHALTANIKTSLPHNFTARQIFYRNGIIAFLPMTDPYLCTIVWSTPFSDAAELVEIPEARFNRRLMSVSESHLDLGACSLVGERRLHALTARLAKDFTSHRLALVGDAAHTFHPLAGQGLNLGLMDAAELSGEVSRLYQQGKDIGQCHYLRRYNRKRKLNATLMIACIQHFYSLFSGYDPLKRAMRYSSMQLVNTFPGIKHTMMQYASGTSDMPDWLY